MATQFTSITVGQTLCKPEDINEEDIRPLILALAKHLNVVLWRDTDTTTNQTKFEVISLK